MVVVSSSCVHCGTKVEGSELNDAVDILNEVIHHTCYYQRNALRFRKGDNPEFIDIVKEKKKKSKILISPLSLDYALNKGASNYDKLSKYDLICAYHNAEEKTESRTVKNKFPTLY